MNDERNRLRADPYLTLPDHRLRSSLSSEMHERRLPPITAPTRLMQIILDVQDCDVPKERKLLEGVIPAAQGSERYLSGVTDDVHFIWERHTEISSYMFIKPGRFGAAFDPAHFSAVPKDWLNSLPGNIVRATQVAIVPSEGMPDIKGAFVDEDLVHCGLLDGLATMTSDFHLKQDGFGRLLISDHGMTAGEVALCVQRLQDLGNYRNLALLGLPVAQGLARHVNSLEQKLSETTQWITDRSVSDDVLLHSLSDLSADVARIVVDTHHRMSATRAYAHMVEDRLRALRMTRLPGNQTLEDFTDRRLQPAVRTCVSFATRLDELSQRVAWTSSLLRTRVDTELSTQNRDLLQSMNRRSAMQLRLQQTVEGLSVVAISYYVVALLSHILAGVHTGTEADRETLVAAIVPVTLICAWLGLKMVHAGRADDADERADTFAGRPNGRQASCGAISSKKRQSKVKSSMASAGIYTGPVFDMARRQFDLAANRLNIRVDERERIFMPKWTIAVSCPIHRDDGSVAVFNDYRVQHHLTLGPTKGGTRFAPTVDVGEVAALAIWVSWKCALVGLPYGGGKGGITVDPYSLSARGLEALSRRYMQEMIPFVGSQIDVMVPDMGTDERVMAWFMDTYSMHHGSTVTEIVTGKLVQCGGTAGRREATGRGVAYLIDRAMERIGIRANEATAIIQGFGNVGAVTAIELARKGIRIVGASDHTAAYYDPQGLYVSALVEYASVNRVLHGYSPEALEDPGDLLTRPCDILVPAALERTITEENAGRLRCRILAEGANGPTTPEADAILDERADIFVLPDILCNAGGVVVSYFEWVQGLQRFLWDEEEVFARLYETPERSLQCVLKRATMDKISNRDAAINIGVETVRNAKLTRGLFP